MLIFFVNVEYINKNDYVGQIGFSPRGGIEFECSRETDIERRNKRGSPVPYLLQKLKKRCLDRLRLTISNTF